MDASAETSSALVALANASLSRSPQADGSVSADTVAWAGESSMEVTPSSSHQHSSVPLTTSQASLSSLQARSPGRSSSMVTLNAVPGPVFQTTIEKLAVSPASIGLLSATMAMFRPGHSTVTASLGLSSGGLVA